MATDSITDPLLSVRGISSGYGPIGVLHDITIDVYPGEIVALLGANGAGKSTTLMAISGIQPLSAGNVLFRGLDISNLPAHERVALGLAQVPEGRRIFPRLTVRDNLLLGAYLRPNAKEMAEQEEYIYSLFPILAERRSQLGGTLSGGEQQMLAMGRALMSKPSMILLDEPSMGIAPLLVRKIFESLTALSLSGLTILLVEQNAHSALAISSRAYVLELGRVTLVGPAVQLASDPRIQEAYLGKCGTTYPIVSLLK